MLNPDSKVPWFPRKVREASIARVVQKNRAVDSIHGTLLLRACMIEQRMLSYFDDVRLEEGELDLELAFSDRGGKRLKKWFFSSSCVKDVYSRSSSGCLRLVSEENNFGSIFNLWQWSEQTVFRGFDSKIVRGRNMAFPEFRDHGTAPQDHQMQEHMGWSDLYSRVVPISQPRVKF